MNVIRSCIFACAILGLPLLSHADGFNTTQVVHWKGVGVPVQLPEGLGGDTVPAGTTCYKVPMFLASNGIRIGSGYDCIFALGSAATTGEGSVSTHYVFAFQGMGSFISENRVILRAGTDNDELNPVLDGEVAFNSEITHILGSLPQGDNIVDGTRRFRKVSGRVRASGAVSQANLPAELVFDTLYVIEFNAGSKRNNDRD